MNLVAKEYVAAQNPEDPGVLILSPFAGAAYELHAAVIANPYDPDAVAEALQTALGMPLEERRERWQAMMVSQDDGGFGRDCDLGYGDRRFFARRRTRRLRPFFPRRLWPWRLWLWRSSDTISAPLSRLSLVVMMRLIIIACLGVLGQ
jgi:hypothetical protein